MFGFGPTSTTTLLFWFSFCVFSGHSGQLILAEKKKEERNSLYSTCPAYNRKSELDYNYMKLGKFCNAFLSTPGISGCYLHLALSVQTKKSDCF